jgi:hypothetical protein
MQLAVRQTIAFPGPMRLWIGVMDIRYAGKKTFVS